MDISMQSSVTKTVVGVSTVVATVAALKFIGPTVTLSVYVALCVLAAVVTVVKVRASGWQWTREQKVNLPIFVVGATFGIVMAVSWP